MAVKDLINESLSLFNEGKYAEAIEKLHQAWDGITDKSTQILNQIAITFLLGRCYSKQVMRVNDKDAADKLFDNAIEYFQKPLELAQKLEKEQLRSLTQISSQFWLGRCYLERIKRSKSTPEAEKFAK